MRIFWQCELTAWDISKVRRGNFKDKIHFFNLEMNCSEIFWVLKYHLKLKLKLLFCKSIFKTHSSHRHHTKGNSLYEDNDFNYEVEYLTVQPFLNNQEKNIKLF